MGLEGARFYFKETIVMSQKIKGMFVCARGEATWAWRGGPGAWVAGAVMWHVLVTDRPIKMARPW